MKLRSKKWLLVLLVFGLAFALVACDDDQGADNGANDTNGAVVDSDTATTDPITIDPNNPEPITITMATKINPPDSQYGILSCPVALYIRERFGITIDAIIAEDGSDWPTRMNALIAANDMPDIFIISDPLQIPMLIQANQILALDAFITPEIMPFTYADNTTRAANILHRQMSDDGTLYTLGFCRGTWDVGSGTLVGNYIRWDLYSQMGYPEINSYQDLLNVLRDMQEMFPTNVHGQTAFAMGGWFADGPGWGDFLFQHGLAWSEGLLIDVNDRTVALDISTNTLSETNLLKDPDGIFWQTMWFYNQAFQMGILDPESFTQTYDMYMEKVESGRYFYVAPRWVAEIAQGTFNEDGMPEIGFVQIPDVSGRGVSAVLSNMPSGERTLGVASKAEHPERILNFLDWMSSYDGTTVVINGVEGVFWNMVDGVPTPNPELFDGTYTSEELMVHGGVGTFGHMRGFANGTIDPRFNQPVDLTLRADVLAATLSIVEQAQLAHFGAASLFDLHTRNLAVFENNSAIDLGSLPAELQLDAANLEDFMFRTLFGIIMASSDAEFAQMRDDFMRDIDQFNADGIHAYYLLQAANMQSVIDEVSALLMGN